VPSDHTHEKRASARAPIELKVEYRRVNSFFADYTRNISHGGTFISTNAPLPIGTRFLFCLTLPGQEMPFELLGEVTWSKAEGDNQGMGICFIWEDDERRRQFERSVEAMMEENLGPELAKMLLKKNT
jgi:type IV pilus assembly protein PilZ